ncbi:MAG: transcriptional regulator, AraC family [Tardiphaga sp.]|nr:transcriptional regulator, AraC family [Tardiphaga sp.]MDB5520427.1 transcriptional regulator, AraC family [Tardiphaga sp.]MDB5547512.1 transcriptional regulator, AraC family [Tardiphaga sp.]MDB5573427.1 transcriptional regulator, AraC family [Tardiphaga sp.]MDB5626938.1 transcriptional regulator, AraC family [Tardiphaga sp.]
MIDGQRRASEHLMLISPERVFYAGLLGRPRKRISGGFNVYVALQGGLSVDDGNRVTTGEIAVVQPYVAHSIDCDGLSIVCMVIEPETISTPAAKALTARCGGETAAAFAAHIRATYRHLHETGQRGEFSTAEFDGVMFGEVLEPRHLDRRIRRAVAALSDGSGARMSAADGAALAALSPSRFLHLFKDETGVSFRAVRAWKRARHLLHYVNEDINLAHLAQQIGYPDSTHFSHSIRRFYGLKPRAIFSGSRDLAIYRSGAWQSPDAA